MASEEFRVEHDSMGELEVPVTALLGAQTQRAVNNFDISPLTMPRPFIRSLGLIKRCAAEVNSELKLIPDDIAAAIVAAADRVTEGSLDAHFPVGVFQTGSGTSSNMNANEVIARVASSESGLAVHPNDHVNYGQSSNDVIPTAISVSAMLELEDQLIPTLAELAEQLRDKALSVDDVIKTGRTHLMDAMPVSMGQELRGWATQIQHGLDRVRAVQVRGRQLAQGGTAVGTGINAHPEFGLRMAERLTKRTGIEFETSENYFTSLASQDAAVELSGQLKVIAVSLMKIANDLRWMNSGPLAGIGEIRLPELQPGSSIMPGKVNPVIPEAVVMVCAQVIGNDTTITIAGQAGNFQLNVMLPVIAYNLLQSIGLLANAAAALSRQAIRDFAVNHDSIEQNLSRNPILVTALNPVIGYDLGAKIAKTAYREGRPVIDVAKELTDLSEAELVRLLDPAKLIDPHKTNQEGEG